MLKKFNSSFLILILILLLSTSLVLAQEEGNKPEIDIGDVLKETEGVEVEEEKEDIPEIEGQEIKEPLKDLGGRKVLVEKIIVEGNSEIADKKLKALVNTAEYTGKKFTLSQMEEAAVEITRYYRQQGYFVARAYIPVQEMENETLKIAVIEGNYGKFILNNNSLIRDKNVQEMLDAVQSENIISVDTIERAMLIINDTPGAVVTQSDVMPGEDLGTSDFAITADASKRFSGYLVADNYGSDYTGQDRLSGSLNINSPFNLGDRISISGLLTDYRGIENYRLAYSLPLSADGLRAEIAYADTVYELGDIFSGLNIEGSSEAIELNFSYPTKRTRLENTEFFADFKYSELEDRQLGVKTAEKTIKSFNTGFEYSKNYRLADWNSQRIFNIDLTMGDLKRSPNNSAVEDTAGIYTKLNLGLEENINFNSKWSLDSSLRTQYSFADQNLDGSEDFSLGGTNGVRLYPSSEHSAEEGYLINLELFYNLPDINNYSHRASIFYDRGYADMADRVNAFESRTLQDLGLGYYLNYKDFFANIHLAYKIDDQEITAEDDYDNRVLIQAGFVF